MPRTAVKENAVFKINLANGPTKEREKNKVLPCEALSTGDIFLFPRCYPNFKHNLATLQPCNLVTTKNYNLLNFNVVAPVLSLSDTR